MKVAVYLGSRPGNSPEFVNNAREMGRCLAQKGIEVVYGGASVGTMGALAQGVLESGGRLTGVFPQGFKGRKENAHRGIDVRNHAIQAGYRLLETPDFDSRIRTMERLSDACIILPGSTGTMHEFFSFYEGNVLGEPRKPIGILNVGGYYDPLVEFIHSMVDHGFTGAEDLEGVIVSPSPSELADRIAEALGV